MFGIEKHVFGDHFRSHCLFSVGAASQILKISYLVDIFIQIKAAVGLGMALADLFVSIRSDRFLIFCSSFSS